MAAGLQNLELEGGFYLQTPRGKPSASNPVAIAAQADIEQPDWRLELEFNLVCSRHEVNPAHQKIATQQLLRSAIHQNFPVRIEMIV